jgi:Holliday junction resolvase
MGSGDRWERNFVNQLRKWDWGAMRAPSSGSGTQVEMPDIIFSKPGWPLVFAEHKWNSGNLQCYEDGEKADALAVSGAVWGARVLWVVRYSTEIEGADDAVWRVAEFDEPGRTDGGNVRLNHSVVKEWETAEEAFG